MEQRFRRQAFYDLVWTEPLATLAPKFGITGTALAKICRRHAIPVPGRGHWAKLKAGKPSPRFPLPPRGLGADETIHIGRTLPSEREAEQQALVENEIPPPPEFDESMPGLLARVAKLVGRVPPTRRLEKPHREIAQLLAADEERLVKWRQSSYPSSFDQPFHQSPYEQRRLKLLDAIFKGLSKAGMRASVQRVKNPEEFYVHVGHTRVTFSLGKPNEQRSTYYAASDMRRPASELMHLDVRWFGASPEGLILSWADRADTRLESMLPQIVAHLIAAGEMCARINEHRQYQWRVDSKQRLIEAERQRRIEAERQERARRQRLEKARIDKLLQEAMSLRLANDIRAYVAAVSNHNAEQAEPVSDSDMVAWSHWALAQADRVDPVSSRAFLQPLSKEETEESDPVQARHGRASTTTAHDPTAPAWHPNRWYARLHR